MTDSTTRPVTVESPIRSILKLSQDKSLTERRLRTQIWGYAKAAIDLIDAEHAKRGSGPTTSDSRAVGNVSPGGAPVVAWLHVWSGLPSKVCTKLADDRYGLSEAIPLCFDEWGEILAWRWADGGGYNADHRYSFVDPLENPEEVEAQGAQSVIACKPLYRHPLVKGYKA